MLKFTQQGSRLRNDSASKKGNIGRKRKTISEDRAKNNTESFPSINHGTGLYHETQLGFRIVMNLRGNVPSPFLKRNVYNAYPITIPSLCVGLSGVKVMYHCTYRCFSQKEEFSRSCFRGIMFKILIFAWINNLNERILDTELEPVLQVRLWGNYSFHTGES